MAIDFEFVPYPFCTGRAEHIIAHYGHYKSVLDICVPGDSK